MNTNELRSILTQDPRTRQQLIDVFALDEFKEYVRNNGLINGIYICNDQISENPGNHWFLIYVESDVINFVDSFAKHFTFYKIDKELSQKPVKILPFQLQSYFTEVCGHYAIFFSYHLSRNKRLETIYQPFSRSNLLQNDEKVFNFLIQTFSAYHLI